jgi:hypothetical protein
VNDSPEPDLTVPCTCGAPEPTPPARHIHKRACAVWDKAYGHEGDEYRAGIDAFVEYLETNMRPGWNGYIDVAEPEPGKPMTWTHLRPADGETEP